MLRHSLLLSLALSPLAYAQDQGTAEFFEERVRPVLEAHCVSCHGPEKAKVGLRLDSPDGVRKGSSGGPVVVPGEPESSLLIEAIRYTDEDLAMPPKGRLDAAIIADLERWVEQGAVMPEGAASKESELDLMERRSHWSFQALRATPAPPVEDRSWALDPLDDYILSSLEQAGLRPAAEAQRAAWLRRVSYDLIGLPPTLEELSTFLEDHTPEAYARAADRLLASPHFGERWARHWLDLVRYAETRGHEFDYVIPNAWQYRDWVVRAFNAGVPFDQFAREHIAGDLLEPPRRHPELGFNESVLGTGFWFLGDGCHSPVDIRADEADRVANQVDVFSRAFLGLTVACARCHDHKFDPISAEDYYALSGFALSASYRQVRFENESAERAAAERLVALDEETRGALEPHLRGFLGAQAQTVTRYLSAATALARGADESSFAQLDAERLAAWSAQLSEATKDSRHPLHFWAHWALAPDGEDLGAWLKGEAERGEAVAPMPTLGWIQRDGHAASRAPLPAGTLLLGDTPEAPVRGLLTRPAYHFDPLFDALETPADNQGEPTSTAGILPGRMLRTETFTLADGRVAVLVRGAGTVYAAVDTHRIIQGPLHGVLVRNFDTGERFEWVELDLREYSGHRAHLELSPRTGEGRALSYAGYLEGPDRTPLAGDHLRSRLARRAVALPHLSEAELLELYSEAWLDAARCVESQPDLASGALLDWALQHLDLFEDLGQRVLAERHSRRRSELRADLAWSSHTAPAMLEGSGVDENVLLRGSAESRGPVARRRFLEAVAGSDQPALRGSGRLELAERVTGPSNPFFSRVWANRLWHHLFGRGLVPTVDDFGAMGQAPSHPELLDRLALDLIQSGWDTKALLRRLVLSRTYRMSSEIDPAAEELDPDNVLLHRKSLSRLDAEALRDTLLAVSGSLDPTLFGPSVPVHLTPFMDGRGRPGESGPLDGAGRRSLYLSVRRNFPIAFMTTFDFPNPAATMGRRAESNVPAQALVLMNDPMVQQEAQRWAERELAEPAQDDTGRVVRMYRRALARDPSQAELEASLEFLRAGEAEPQVVWADFAHVLFNTKELRFLP